MSFVRVLCWQDAISTHAEIPSQVSGFENIIHDAVAVCGNLGLSKQIEMVLHDVYMNTVFPAHRLRVRFPTVDLSRVPPCESFPPHREHQKLSHNDPLKSHCNPPPLI